MASNILNSLTKNIDFVFNLSKLKGIPKDLREVESESLEKYKERKNREVKTLTKILFDSKREHISLLEFVNVLLAMPDYKLVDAFFKKRYKTEIVKDEKVLIEYYYCKFSFRHISFGHVNENEELYRKCLLECCKDVFWSVSVYDNPYYFKNIKIVGANSICIKSVGRDPLYNCKGEELIEYEKDENREFKLDSQGNKIKKQKGRNMLVLSSNGFETKERVSSWYPLFK